jgi:hypothetical protein
MQWASLAPPFLLAVTSLLVCIAWAIRDAYLKSRAESRGLQLLEDNLSDKQLHQYRTRGYFYAVGCISGNRYRIAYGTVQNVVQLSRSGQPELGRCFMPKGDLVAGDCMLAQKIAIENCEQEMLRAALPFQVLEAMNRFR